MSLPPRPQAPRARVVAARQADARARLVPFAILAALAAALTLLALPARAQQAGERIPTISLNATGESVIDPDKASISAGVVSQAATAAEALAQNSAAMNRVFAELRDAGVAERDIQTSALSVSPVYAPQNGVREDGPRIIAYRANNTVTATVRDLDKVGPAIDALVTAGANNVGNVSFGREDDSEALDAARAQAIQKALATARLYAEAGGFQLGRILQVNESQSYYPPQPYMARMEMAQDAGAPTPTAPGQLTVTAQVYVEIEIIQ